VLAGAEPERIVACAREMLPRRGGWANPFGDGHAGERIVDHLRGASA
jgi:UDP-N-acetylglucosamine 2-epimerase (non-hydrolysing)